MIVIVEKNRKANNDYEDLSLKFDRKLPEKLMQRYMKEYIRDDSPPDNVETSKPPSYLPSSRQSVNVELIQDALERYKAAEIILSSHKNNLDPDHQISDQLLKKSIKQLQLKSTNKK